MKDEIFKILFSIHTHSILRRFKNSNSVTVLNLHRISEERDFFYNPILPEKFEKIIEYCCLNYEVISFENLNKKTKKPKLILSFDDGYYDFKECALPILIKKGLPSNHNIVNDSVNNNKPIWTHYLNEIFCCLKSNHIIDDEIISKYAQFNRNWYQYYVDFFSYLLSIKKADRDIILSRLTTYYNIKLNTKMMNWNDIRYCIKNDVEIGSHSYTHDSLNTISNIDEFNHEVLLSINEIEEKIEKKINIFALPNGQYNEYLINCFNTTKINHLLFVDNKINTNLNTDKISRIGLNDNTLYENILKIELFHSKLKK